MKRLFVSIFALTAISLSVAAQDSTKTRKQENQEMKAAYKGGKKDKKEKMKALNLTEDQKKEMKANREELKTNMLAIDNDKSLSDAQKNEKKAALKKEQRAKSQSLLTPEQKTKMMEAKKQDKEEDKAKAEKRMEEMKTKLALSDEQAGQLKALNMSNHQKMKDIRKDQSLDEAAKQKQLDELKKNSDEKQKAILTADQYKKMQEMKAAHKGKGPKKPKS